MGSWALAATALLASAVASAELPEPDTTTAAEASPYTTVIVGSRTPQLLKDSSAAVEVLSRRDIEMSGATDLAELLAEAPGVELVPSFGATGMRLQGLDPQYVLVLVDGERTIGRIDGAIDLKRFRAEDIERVEIVKGPGSALYGSDALAGVVNLVTRRGVRFPIVGVAQQ